VTANTTAPAPPLGPGMRGADPRERFGRLEADERFATLDDPFAALPDNTEVDVAGLLADSRVEEVLAQLDRDLVGLRVVKDRIREIAALLVVDRMRRRLGLEAEAPTLHMCFTGNPGTGKTTMAARMGQILHRLGYVRRGHLVSVTRDDLVGQYVGHTAPKTREVLKRAMGGVLFIDEAYHMYRVDNERDYGQETVEILLQVMENQRDDLVVIMAGYKDRMDRFFSDVPGLSSRIAHHIEFPDYDLDELMGIARLMAAEQRYRLGGEAEDAFREYLQTRREQPRFANGRSVRNALDRVRLRHAIRIYEAAAGPGRLTKNDLVTIAAEDVRRSRVFDGGFYGAGSD
jgi:probable Rubsico expression protein CbbX